MRKRNFWLFSLAMLLNVFFMFGPENAFAQCGIPGAPPCVKAKRMTPRKTAPSRSKANPTKRKPSDGASTLANNADSQGYAGILVETLDGKVTKEGYSNYAFNPGQNVKVATAYAVIKTFGPNYRFPTNVFADGTIDTTTGTLNGNIYISGRDPIFTLEHSVALADALNRYGIRQVKGDLIVTDKFVMSQSGSAARSAQMLYAALDARTRSVAVVRAWKAYLTTSGKTGQNLESPSISFTGQVYVDVLPVKARLLLSHESAPLREIVKVMMCYSNNFLAERLGDMLGGAYAVARVVQASLQIPAEEFFIQTSSGGGVNRVTPRAMMRLLRGFRTELARYKMTLPDVLPVGGVDPGIIQKRFNSPSLSGSVAAKAGNLPNIDAGVSSLVGEVQTQRGKLLFVIFNQRGNTLNFQNFQNAFLRTVQEDNSGSALLDYQAPSLSVRLANTRITYPNTRAQIADGTKPFDGPPVVQLPAARPPVQSVPRRTTKPVTEGDSPFISEYVGDNSPPTITIKNDSNRALALTFGGVKYQIKAGGSETVTLEGGAYEYLVSAPGVRALGGVRNFERGHRYSWVFYIVTRRVNR